MSGTTCELQARIAALNLAAQSLGLDKAEYGARAIPASDVIGLAREYEDYLISNVE